MRTVKGSPSKRTRFEVFKRDSFTCQYCGAKAPDVVLEVDHIDPKSKGGSNTILNLVTACKSCNSGKSDKSLSDHSVIEAQRKQLEDVQDRKEQLSMLFRWQKSLYSIDNDAVSMLCNHWDSLRPGWTVNITGRQVIHKLYKKYGLQLVMEAMAAAQRYLREEDGKLTQKSVEESFNKLGAICWMKTQEKENPKLAKAYYLRSIIKGRFGLDWQLGDALKIILAALDKGVNPVAIENICRTEYNYRQWNAAMEKFLCSGQ